MPAPDYAVEIATLEGMLLSGEREISSGGFGGDRVVFKSTDELLKTLTYFKNQAAANAPKSATTAASYCQD